jgi:site-specific DNA-methyltransferase (adenine-specific)
VAVIVIGDVADPGKDPRPLAAQIWTDVGSDTGLDLLELVQDHLPVHYKVSRIWGETKGQATARDCALVLRRDDGEPDIGPEAVDWDEPYKDGGPDVAHARLKDMRIAS